MRVPYEVFFISFGQFVRVAIVLTFLFGVALLEDEDQKENEKSSTNNHSYDQRSVLPRSVFKVSLALLRPRVDHLVRVNIHESGLQLFLPEDEVEVSRSSPNRRGVPGKRVSVIDRMREEVVAA